MPFGALPSLCLQQEHIPCFIFQLLRQAYPNTHGKEA